MATAYAGEPGKNALCIVDFGEERCVPGHAYGPAVRQNFLIHYVASGEGMFSAQGRLWAVGPGQGFVIFPGEVTSYRADLRAPWHYGWVGYRGEGAEELTRRAGLSRERRVFSAPQAEPPWEALERLRQDAATLRLGPLAALGGLYRFLALVAPLREEDAAPDHARHYEKALWYMQGAYTRPVTIQEIADFVGLSRSQLFRIFEKNGGQSPKEALQDMRLRQARALLEKSGLSLEQIALSSGFGSGAQLSAAIRARWGCSPRALRQDKR